MAGQQGHLRIDAKRGPGGVVLLLEGELDLAGAPTLDREIGRAEADTDSMVALDLENLSFIDSSGLRVILAAHERAREAGRQFAVTRGSQQVQRLFATAGVDGYLLIVDSSEELLG
jgi:anti-sigma B factor antagonist